MSIFKKIKAAKVSKGGNYMRAGHYLAFLRNIKQDTSRKDIPFIAVEMVVLESLDNKVEEPHRPGEEATHLLMADKDSFLGNFKGMVANLAGAEADDVDEETAEEVVSVDQPLSGKVIEVIARDIETRAGKPFTVIDYKRTLPTEEVEDRVGMANMKLSLTQAEIDTLLAG